MCLVIQLYINVAFSIIVLKKIYIFGEFFFSSEKRFSVDISSEKSLWLKYYKFEKGLKYAIGSFNPC